MEIKKSELSAKNISKNFIQGKNTLNVITDISIKFEQGQSYAITGVSGSGKSTLLQILSGLDTPSQGSVIFNGQNIANQSPAAKQQFLNKKIGLVFQQPYLIKELSVLENCMLRSLIAQQNYSEGKKLALSLLEAVGIADKAYCTPASLSGGQQQRVALVRAIFNQPDFLIADEPTGSLDTKTAQEIIDLLIRCNREWGMGIIVSSHDQEVAARMEKVYHLHDGYLHQIK